MDLEQQEELERVSSRIAGAVLSFCTPGAVFHAQDLRDYVTEETGIIAPASADRVLRDLRQKGQVSYKVLSRSQSLYQIVEVNPERKERVKMPRVRKDPGAEPKPKAPPKTDPLEGLDYTVEKVEGGKWKAECLGTVSYGVTKKAALSMLSNELNGFKEEPGPGPVSEPTPTPTQTSTKGESYSIDDAELLWGIEFPGKPELLRELFQERISLKTDADRIKERIETINKSLLSFFDRQGVEKVTWEDWTVAKVNGSNSTLDKEALVLAGVPAETIARCTKRKEYTTVRVTGPKGGE